MSRQYGLIQRPKTLFEQARDRRKFWNLVGGCLTLCVFLVFAYAVLLVT